MSVNGTTPLSKTKGQKKKKVARRPKSMKGKVAQLSKTVSSMKRELASAIEVKNLDSTLVATNFDNLGNFLTPLNNPAQGLGNQFRVGDEITCTGLSMRYRIMIDPAAAGAPTFQNLQQRIRVIIFWDHEGNMVSTDILESSTLGTGLAPLSLYPRASRGAFSIVYDKVHTLDIVENLQETVSLNLKLNKDTRFAPGSASIERNALRVFICTNAALGSGTARPQFEMVNRLWYKDA